MKVFKGYRRVDHSPRGAVVAIGNFDGVHPGHRKIIETAIEQARVRKGTAVVYTFRPHPQLVLRPGGGDHQLLSTYDEKLALLGALGVDWAVEEPFDREFSATSPEKFFTEILRGALGAEAIVVGYDFGFGKDRAAGIEALRGLCAEAGVALTIVPPFEVAPGEVVSSSRIRRALLDGDLPLASRLLGREFSYRGKVEHGEARGRKLGFPTANLRPDKLVLPYGVYATRTECEGVSYPSVTNLGVRPTFVKPGSSEAPPVLIESHLLDQTRDLYDREIEVRFVRRLRGEEKFPGLEALRAQITRDVENARAALEN